MMSDWTSDKELPLTIGTTDIYAKENNIGVRYGFSGIKINDEEILIFGGNGNIVGFPEESENFLNLVQKYNISSNMWKYVSGKKEMQDISDISYPNEYGREYNSTNLIGGRVNHKIWKVSNNEFVVFGGFGFDSTKKQSVYFLNDQWFYNYETDQWKFDGQETTKYGNRYATTSLFGGNCGFIGEYISKVQNLFICTGYGFGISSYGNLNDCWRIYLGNICNSIEESEETVCLSHGKCIDYNTCECDSSYFGSNCELTKCYDILSNETSVCSGNGICSNSNCFCYDTSIYTNRDCSIDESLKHLFDNLWIYITIPLVIAGLILLITFSTIIFTFICIKQKKKLKKMDGIEDIDLILNEARIEQKSNKPKIKIDKSLFEIQYKDLKLISVLGEGGQSVVYLIEWKGEFCTFKSFKKEMFSTETNQFYSEFEKEVKLYSNIRHPSILQFYGACVNPPNVGLVLQYCENSDIPTFFRKHKLQTKEKYEFGKKVRLLTEIAKGLQYLHSINIYHRDLKPENILIDENEHAKIMDFGLSKFLNNSEEKTMTKRIGTSYYMAPEVFKGEKYANKCDVFSFAILIYVVITENYFPYGTELNENLILHKVSSSETFRPKIEKKEFKNCPTQLIDLIKRNWNSNPKKRNSFVEIVEVLLDIDKENQTQKRKGKKPIFSYEEFEKLQKDNENFKIKEKELKKEIAKLKKQLSKNNQLKSVVL